MYMYMLEREERRDEIVIYYIIYIYYDSYDSSTIYSGSM